MSTTSGLMPVGKVIKPHGLKGLLRIISYSGTDTSLNDAETVFLRSASGETQEFAVISVNPHKSGFLMAVADLVSLDAAETWRGAEILIQRDTLTCEAGVYLWDELLDMTVYLENGEVLGKVVHIIPTGANDVYVVRQGEKEFLIPAIAEVVREIDPENRKMTISPMEGLLALNEI